MNQALYLESISIMTKEFLSQSSFEDFLQSVKREVFALLSQRGDVEKDTIRKAIMDFMAQRGMKAIVLFSTKGVEIKTAILHRERNAYVDFLVRYLDEKHYIEQLKSNDFSCLKDIFLSLQELQITDESLIKDIVRGALKKVLGLSERDGLFFSDVDPLIKNFDFELVQNNAQIRELRKSHHKQSLLDDVTRSRIDHALRDSDISLMKQIVQEIIHSRFSNLKPLEFLSGFSFAYIQGFAKALESILQSSAISNQDSSLSARVLNYYCVESYRAKKESIYEELAQEVLHMLDSGSKAAQEFIVFFSGRSSRFNSRELYVPVIEDMDAKVWALGDIEFILHSERDINNAIKSHQQKISTASARLLAIEQETKENNELMHQKQLQIQTLSEEYEQKKSQAAAYEKADIETRNAMTKIINALLQQKIQTLDSIATLKSQNTALQDEKYALQNTQKNAQAEIALITRENKESLYRFHNLLRALSACISAVVRDLDDYA